MGRGEQESGSTKQKSTPKTIIRLWKSKAKDFKNTQNSDRCLNLITYKVLPDWYKKHLLDSSVPAAGGQTVWQKKR